MGDQLEDLLKKPALVLLSIARNPGCTTRSIQEDQDIAYSYVSRIVKEKREEGKIRVKKDGRKNKLYLTEKCDLIGDGLRKIAEGMHNNNHNSGDLQSAMTD